MFFDKLFGFLKPQNARADIPTVAVTGDVTPEYSDKLTIEAVQVVVDASKQVPPQADVHVRMLFDETGDMMACHVEHLCPTPPLGASGTSTLVDSRRSPAPSALPTTSHFVPVSDLKLTAASRILSSQSATGPKLSMADFRVFQVIGSGGQGTVMLVQYARNGLLYALKAMRKSAMKGNDLAFAFQEQAILKTLVGSPWFLQLRGSFEDSEYFYLLTDAYCAGDLAKRLHRRGKLSNFEARNLAAQLVLGLEELHKRRIIHRDIKPANILVNSDGNLVYSDFGFARAYDLADEKQPWRLRDEWTLRSGADLVSSDAGDVTNRVCGTQGYTAPEVQLQGVLYSYAADIFSLGVVVYQTLCDRLPFGIGSNRDRRVVYELTMTRAVEVDDDVEAPAHDLLCMMLEKDPARRPSLEEIKAHPWFAPIDWKALAMRQEQRPNQVGSSFQPDVGVEDIQFGTEHAAGEAPHWWYEWSSPALITGPVADPKKSLRKNRATWKKQEPRTAGQPSPMILSTPNVPAALSAMFVTPALPSVPAEKSPPFLAPLPRSYAPSPTLCASNATATTAVSGVSSTHQKDKISFTPSIHTPAPSPPLPPTTMANDLEFLSGVRRTLRGVKTVKRGADRNVDLLA